MNENINPDYGYSSAGPTWSNHYLWPVLEKILRKQNIQTERVFEVGCGSGATAKFMADMGLDVTGIDPSESGIEIANEAFPELKLHMGSAYDDLASMYGTYPLVVSLEVVEHCYYPREYARTIFNLLDEDGVAIISTPYHAYWKNLAMALAGKWDFHLTALWDGGHIKFFSMDTLTILVKEAGFSDVSFIRVGRIPALAKSMVAVVKK